jgi:hypothetical protein
VRPEEIFRAFVFLTDFLRVKSSPYEPDFVDRRKLKLCREGRVTKHALFALDNLKNYALIGRRRGGRFYLGVS